MSSLSVLNFFLALRRRNGEILKQYRRGGQNEERAKSDKLQPQIKCIIALILSILH